jgi:hypothetical protein
MPQAWTTALCHQPPWPESATRTNSQRHIAISWQIFKALQSVETVNRDLRHGLWFREPQVDRDATSSVFIGIQRSPEGHAATRGAEMKTIPLPLM